MISRLFDALSVADILDLPKRGATEARDLEFKRDLPDRSDGGMKEFLADVTSLANAQGGDLVFGVGETSGVASAADGVEVPDADAEILRLEGSVRDGIEPRIHGVRTRWLELEPGCGFLVMRLPASMAAPHRIRFKNSGRFYSRNSRGKYEMDTHELRQAFTASEQLPARFRALHAKAAAGALGDDMPFGIDPGPAAVASIVPLGLFREARDLDVTPERALAPRGLTGAMNYMHTLEGLLAYPPVRDTNTVRSYALTHRAGRTDSAWTIGGTRTVGPNATARLVWPDKFEVGLLEMMRYTRSKLESFGVEGPWVVLVSVLAIKGHKLVLPYDNYSEPAWRDFARLPEVVVEQPGEAGILPLFQSFWRMFGVQRGAPV